MKQLTWKPQVRGLAFEESPDSFLRLLQGKLNPSQQLRVCSPGFSLLRHCPDPDPDSS